MNKLGIKSDPCCGHLQGKLSKYPNEHAVGGCDSLYGQIQKWQSKHSPNKLSLHQK